jgi:hypothetical protein
MKAIALAVVAVVGLAVAARSWEATAGQVAKRRTVLAKAWAGKEGLERAPDKLARAKQTRRPAWTEKTVWKEVRQGKTYWFGVGIAAHIKNAALGITAAEDRAGSEIVKAKKSEVQVEETKGANGTSRKTILVRSQGTISRWELDWYRDEAEGAWYALVVSVE